MSTSTTDRDAKHARQGIETAARLFSEIRVNALTADETRAGIDEALARIDAGSGPQAFKDAVRSEFASLFSIIFPGATPLAAVATVETALTAAQAA